MKQGEFKVYPVSFPKVPFFKSLPFLTVQLCHGLSQLTKLDCLRMLKTVVFDNCVALSFSKVRQLAILCKIYPKPSNLPQGLNFGILGKCRWGMGFSAYLHPSSSVLCDIGDPVFTGDIGTHFCKLVHKFDHTHTEKDSFANLEIGAQVVSL